MSNDESTSDTPEPFPGISSGGLSGDTGAERLGSEIGPYKLLNILGEGGYGIVYLAEQREPVKRRVALKLIKPGMDSKEVLARFEAERQALALLDHPNIAHVFDAGSSSSGHPYFAMEYVDGASITEYCDHHKLSIEDRLQLFIEVCRAIQHAHEKGIIHRDIKPSNVLVSLQGQKAVPKVIDFGVVKAMSLPLTERTLFTERGQLLGTPEYMSPEQADMAVQDIDTRSDIYSLGAVLYVLLTGALPFDRKSLERAGFAEIQRILREQDPPRPSTRLSILGEEAEKIAKSRNTQVLSLTRRLQKELEWIPLKAMRKERERRYRTVLELADDVDNYLKGAPLIAGPESTLYRIRKFVRRHSVSIAAALIVVVALLFGLVISSTMYFKSEQALDREGIARSRAETAEKQATERAEEYRRSLYFNRTALAEASYRYGHINSVLNLLESCPTDLRGWEWHYLNRISNQAHLTFKMPGSNANSVSFSPDGTRIVSGDRRTKIIIWDAATGQQLLILRGHKGQVNTVDFNPDGERIVSASSDKTIKIWNATKGIELMTLYGHEGSVGAWFSPDGNRIISISHDKTIRLWDTVTGENQMIIRGHKELVYDAALSPDGSHIVSCGRDNTVKIWDPNTGKELSTFPGHLDWINKVTFSPDGRQIIMVGHDNIIRLFDPKTGREIMVFRGHRSSVKSVEFSQDGKYIVSTGSWDNTIKLWDVATGEEIITLRGHKGHIKYAEFSPDGDQIVSCGDDLTIKVWDLVTSTSATQFRYHSGQVNCVTFSPDGERIASGGDDNLVKIFDVSSGRELLTLRGHSAGITSLVFGPNGKLIASASYDNSCRIWDATSGVELKNFTGHEELESFNSVTFCPDGRHIASGSGDSTIYVWNVTNGNELMRLFGHENEINSVAYSPDGKYIISGSWDGTVKIWDTTTGNDVMSLSTGADWEYIHCVMFSPDGKKIVAGSSFAGIKIWDADTGYEVMTLGRDVLDIESAAFSPDGKRIVAAGGYDGTIRIWDVMSGTQALTLRGSHWGVEDIAFSPDGKTIVAAWDDGTVRLFESDVPSGGYGPRKTVNLTRNVTEKLYEKHGQYIEVINAIKSDASINGSMREVALQIAEARRWEDSVKLKEESWEIICTEGADKESYHKALEKARQADIIDPNNPSILIALGGAQCRVGNYQDALQTLSRIDETQADKESRSVKLVFTAMSLHQLNRDEGAQDALNELHKLLEPSPTFYIGVVQDLLFEAEKLLADENPKLHLIWEYIENEERDEAVKLVNQLWLSQNQGYTNKINRAAQWLAKIYFKSGYSRFGSEYDYNKKIRDYEIAIRMDPNYAEALHELAWTYATCEVSKLRNSEKAVDIATKACELTNWKFHRYISTLAIACSEASDFSAASMWQRKAIDMLSEDELDHLHPNYLARLKLYESREPYHKGSSWSFTNGELVAWWKFDKVEDGNVVDSSGHSRKGKLIGDAHIIPDPQRGNVLSLDGKGDFVDCGKHPDLYVTGSITISCWVKVNEFEKKRQVIIAGGGPAWQLSRFTDSNSIGFVCIFKKPDNSPWQNTGKEWWIGSIQNKNVHDGQWHHVTGVYDGDKIYFYLDGTLGDYAYVRGNLNAETYHVYIGRSVEIPWKEWNGLIDDVRIYSYALSDAEIRDLYNGKNPPLVKE